MINNALFKETIDARIFASLLRIGSRWVSPIFFLSTQPPYNIKEAPAERRTQVTLLQKKRTE